MTMAIYAKINCVTVENTELFETSTNQSLEEQNMKKRQKNINF